MSRFSPHQQYINTKRWLGEFAATLSIVLHFQLNSATAKVKYISSYWSLNPQLQNYIKLSAVLEDKMHFGRGRF
ncbi:MAG: hypothetical protein ACXABG_13905 [Promethearchaeota archaeon]